MRAQASPPSIKGAVARLCLPFGRGTSGSPKIRVQGGKGCQPTGPPSKQRQAVTVRAEKRRIGSLGSGCLLSLSPSSSSVK